MKAFLLRAPAKINLYLRVLGRRADGYHEIETLFQRIDLADEISFESHPSELILTCSDPDLSCAEDNLIIKAACLLKAKTATRQGASIHLTKRIPIAAGLGGGSSDAASTLLGLNELWELGLTRPTLIELASQLGSDVPFFLCSSAFAIGRGRGQRCEEVSSKLRLIYVLVNPALALSTQQVYEFAQFDLTQSKPSLSMVRHALANGSLDELALGLWNDLEPEAIRRCPSSGILRTRLVRLGCLAAWVSGSGPTVIGLCRDLLQAQQIVHQLQAAAVPTWRIEIAQTDARLLRLSHCVASCCSEKYRPPSPHHGVD